MNLIEVDAGLLRGHAQKGRDQSYHLAKAVTRIGLKLANFESAVAADPTGNETEVEANQLSLE